MSDSTATPDDIPDLAALQAQVAELKGVPVALLQGAGETPEEIGAYADAVLTFTRPAANSGLYVPTEGKNPGPPKPSSEHQFVQQLFNPDYPNAL